MIRIGTVGTGFIVDDFFDAVSRVDGVEITCVYSRDAEKAEAFAKEWNIPQVCFNNANIPVAKKIMEEEGITDIALMGTAAFPTGCFPTEIKLAEIEFCARNGCKEIDICSNQGFLKSNMFDEFEADIVACVKAAHEAGLVIKIIVEAASITPAANPESAFPEISGRAFFIKNTAAAPKAVPKKGRRIPKPTCIQ